MACVERGSVLLEGPAGHPPALWACGCFSWKADCWENTAFQAARQHLPRNAVEVTIFQREMAEIANFDQRGQPPRAAELMDLVESPQSSFRRQCRCVVNLKLEAAPLLCAAQSMVMRQCHLQCHHLQISLKGPERRPRSKQITGCREWSLERKRKRRRHHRSVQSAVLCNARDQRRFLHEMLNGRVHEAPRPRRCWLGAKRTRQAPDPIYELCISHPVMMTIQREVTTPTVSSTDSSRHVKWMMFGAPSAFTRG